MIPSDHFPRFYNEVFKFLERQGEDVLESYWLEISKNQERHALDLFRDHGLAGMETYWTLIRDEENCDLDLSRSDDSFELKMNKCPSLTKVLDSDAEPMGRYCDHCAGWIGPIMDKLGYHLVYDAKSRSIPQCRMRVFTDAAKAAEAEQEAELLMHWPGKKTAR